MADTLPEPATIPDSSTGTARSAHATTQAWGLSLLAGSILLLIAAAIITGLDLAELVGFLLVPAVVLIIAVALTLRFGTWAKVVGVLVALAAAGMLFWLAFGIFEPASFVDFISGTAFTIGMLLAVGGGIAAIVRRNSVGPTRSERQLTRAAAAVMVLAVVVSVPLWFFTRDTVSAEEAAGATHVVAHDFTFEPKEIAVESGATLYLDNNDAFLHTFTIDELGIDVQLLPGEEALVTVDDTGSFTFYCQPHSNPEGADPGPDSDDMAGTITIG